MLYLLFAYLINFYKININFNKMFVITIAAVIGQKNMSKKELQRRELTNTLNITSITSAMTLLGLAPDYYPNIAEGQSFKTTTECIAFKVESSSKFFFVPPTLKIPLDPPSAVGEFSSCVRIHSLYHASSCTCRNTPYSNDQNVSKCFLETNSCSVVTYI